MGYDIHITRKEFWADEDDKNRIEKSEWDNLVKDDESLIAVGNDEDYIFILNIEDFINKFNRNIEEYHNENQQLMFWYHAELGEIYIKNPPKEQIVKMFAISQLLNAKVQGDDEEIYDEYGEIK